MGLRRSAGPARPTARCSPPSLSPAPAPPAASPAGWTAHLQGACEMEDPGGGSLEGPVQPVCHSTHTSSPAITQSRRGSPGTQNAPSSLGCHLSSWGVEGAHSWEALKGHVALPPSTHTQICPGPFRAPRPGKAQSQQLEPKGLRDVWLGCPSSQKWLTPR